MIDSSALKQAGFRGECILPDDPGYDDARTVFNRAIDRRPAMIARCADADDVARIVQLARQFHIPLAVRGSGHNVAGYGVCDDGIVLDLSRMKAVTVDPSAGTVRVEGGSNWGEVNDALQPYGLAATGGFVSITGVAGLTLGGGFGWLVRKHGLALDNLLAAEVVLADGKRVSASAHENEELFWALRGGGGNFGVVTSFDFKVYPAGTVLAGIVLHPANAAAGAIRKWRDFHREAPDGLTLGALLLHMPDDPSLPPLMRGAPVAGIGGVYAGPVEEGEEVLRPLRGFGRPLADHFAATQYKDAQRMADHLWPPGLHGYWKSSYVAALDDAAIDVVVDHFARVPSPHTVIVMEYYGNSAWNRVENSATAFGARSWPWNIAITSAWADASDTERNVAWTRGLFEALAPYRAPAAYVNYLGGDEGPAGLRMAYGTKLERLAEIKERYDPTNLFRLNQNILPGTKELGLDAIR
ncbi:FAD-binding oxidoreductase [Caballeronia grimmiae]|uniref:FAD-binding oxidoreductase n=1 Tax=Caballeronia grimmiae TaxID=1071679 RepID=UPI0038BD3E33